MRKWKWNKEKFGKMIYENICRMYSPDKKLVFDKKPQLGRGLYITNGDKKYTVRWNRYEPGANFSGDSIDSDYFVLKGKCEITINETTNNLQASDCFEFPRCKYKFKVIGNEFFEYIAVYRLPDDYI